jgi:NadR type nicotinamide-nucleotide adenylyltransferase
MRKDTPIHQTGAPKGRQHPRRIVVIGPESTGKSSLSQALAALYHTVWVPEYARTYLETLNRPYTEKDLLTIAHGQLALEDEQAASANGLLICDTDLHVIKVWSEHRYGRCAPWILQQIEQRRYDLYLLTDIDIRWEDDPLREHPEPEMRLHFYKIYKDIVQNSGVPWAPVSGEPEKRLAAAAAAIQHYVGEKAKP